MTPMSIRSAVTSAPGYRLSARAHTVKLDQNESPYDLPDDVRERALARIADADLHRYPDLHADRVRRRIAELEGWPEAGVVVASGSNVLIQALVIAGGIGRRVLCVAPTFAVYSLQARLLGADLTEVALVGEHGSELPERALTAELANGVGVHFMTDPMAPTGNALPHGSVERLIAAGGDRWLSVIDEAYGAFAGSDHRELVRRAPNAVSIRTLSKAYGLGGVRLGYALAAPAVATELQKAILPFSVSILQLAVVEAVLDDPSYVEARVRESVAERERVARALRALPGVHVHPSVTNFLLLSVGDAERTYERLLEAGVLVRRQDHLPGLRGALRVSIGSPSDNDAFLAAMASSVDRERADDREEAPHATG